jgi:hypothetical protein
MPIVTRWWLDRSSRELANRCDFLQTVVIAAASIGIPDTAFAAPAKDRLALHREYGRVSDQMMETMRAFCSIQQEAAVIAGYGQACAPA